MKCPYDLIFEEKTQRCEWILPLARMASLKAAERFIMSKNSQTYSDEVIKALKGEPLDNQMDCNCTNNEKSEKSEKNEKNKKNKKQ
jgi:hypothetical protein